MLKKAVLALIGLLYPGLVGLVLRELAAAGWRGGLPALEARPLAIAAWGLAAVGALNLATPWRRRTRWLAGASHDPGLRLLVVGLPFIAAPASYGLLLYFLGLALAPIYPFLAASFVAALVWDLATLRGRFSAPA